MSLRGPMFDPARDQYRESVHGQEGGHYNIFASRDPRTALAMLRAWFPDAKGIDELNLVLFSTSGVHGSYVTIEEVEQDIKEHGDAPRTDDDDRCGREVTFLVVMPRIVSMTYGNTACETLADVRFLKKLRAASWKAAGKVGKP